MVATAEELAPQSPVEEAAKLDAEPMLSASTSSDIPEIPADVAGDVEKFKQERGEFYMAEDIEKSLDGMSGKIGDFDARNGMSMRELTSFVSKSKESNGELAALYDKYVELHSRLVAGENNARLVQDITETVYDIFVKASEMRDKPSDETTQTTAELADQTESNSPTITEEKTAEEFDPFMAHVNEQLDQMKDSMMSNVQEGLDKASAGVQNQYEESLQNVDKNIQKERDRTNAAIEQIGDQLNNLSAETTSDQWNVPGAESITPGNSTEDQTAVLTTPSTTEVVNSNGHSDENLENTTPLEVSPASDVVEQNGHTDENLTNDTTMLEAHSLANDTEQNGHTDEDITQTATQVEGTEYETSTDTSDNETSHTNGVVTGAENSESQDQKDASYYFKRFDELLKQGQQGMQKDATPEARAQSEAALNQARELARLAGPDATAQVDKIISDLSKKDEAQKGGLRNLIPGFRNRGTHLAPEVVDREIREALKTVATASGEPMSEEAIKEQVDSARKDDTNRKRIIAAAAIAAALAVGAIGTAKAPGNESSPMQASGNSNTELLEKNQMPETPIPTLITDTSTSAATPAAAPTMSDGVNLTETESQAEAKPSTSETIISDPFAAFMQEKVDMNQNAGTPGDNLWTAEKKDFETAHGDDGWVNENTTLQDGEHPNQGMVLGDMFSQALQKAVNDAAAKGEEFDVSQLDGKTNQEVAEILKMDVNQLKEVFGTQNAEDYLKLGYQNPNSQ